MLSISNSFDGKKYRSESFFRELMTGENQRVTGLEVLS
jgi:hypothetical protein